MDIYEKSLKMHYVWSGKIETKLRVPLETLDDLALCYTPGVSQACREIARDKSLSFALTRRHNTVAVITDGTAVLGLGDIGPEAAMPVMEGKCALFKAFADIDAVPVCLDTKDPDKIVEIIAALAKSYGGINLEDISAPRCFYIEDKLKQLCDIPVFHDDQHGTAIVAGAALTNALKVVGKRLDNVRVVINGAGSAGVAIAKFFVMLGVGDVVAVDKCGAISAAQTYANPAHEQLKSITNKTCLQGSLSDVMRGADVFLGVSAPKIVSAEMIRSMNANPIVFPLANPVPEITREEAIEAGATVVGTGASGKPNQINNLLAFPGIFRGALDAGAKDITERMKLAASRALAELVGDDELHSDYILPSPLDKRVAPAVAKAVKFAAIDNSKE